MRATRNIADDAMKVWRVLGRGIREAKLSNQIAEDAGLPRERTDVYMREIARFLNFQGFEVVSDSCGFWKAETPEEIEGYRESLLGRSRSLIARCNALTTIADRMRQKEE